MAPSKVSFWVAVVFRIFVFSVVTLMAFQVTGWIQVAGFVVVGLFAVAYPVRLFQLYGEWVSREAV